MEKQLKLFGYGKSRVRAVGDSLYLNLGTEIKNQFALAPGRLLSFKVWEPTTITVICPKCKKEFTDAKNSDPYDCPNCGEEFLNVDKIEAEK